MRTKFTHDGETVHLTLMVDYGDGLRPFLTRWDVVEALIGATQIDHEKFTDHLRAEGIRYEWDVAKASQVSSKPRRIRGWRM